MTFTSTFAYDVTMLTDGEPANLYATREFLEAVAEFLYPERHCSVNDFAVGDEVFRLLCVDGEPLEVTPFIDMHEPLLEPRNLEKAISLRRLPKVSRAIADLEDFKSNQSWQDFAGGPTVFWKNFPTWEKYLELLRARRILSDDQRRWRRLEEAVGKLSFQSNDFGKDVLPTCFEWKSARDKELDRVDMFARDDTRALFAALQQRGLMRASTLRGGDQLLAMWLGWVHRGRWSGWVTAYNADPSFGKYSLGRQMLYPMLEESYRAGHNEFDFSIGMEPYKLFFSTHARAIANVGQPRIQERVRGTVKAVLRRSPWLYEKVKALRG
jgi:hypothetical protein